jgi:hypothetical protein
MGLPGAGKSTVSTTPTEVFYFLIVLFLAAVY